VQPIRFIGERIEVRFETRPRLEKRPGCPSSFAWRGTAYAVVDLLSEWHDYERRGRAAHSMRPSHAAAAERRGSWGVGRDYYRVATRCGRIFDLYYDRAPGSALERKGEWFLLREMAPAKGSGGPERG